MNKQTIKRAGAVVGAATLAVGSVAAAQAIPQAAPQAQSLLSTSVAEEREAPASNVATAKGIAVSAREEAVYATIANVKGEFEFDQNVITPPDEVFNLFGTAATAMCAKPGFAFDNVKQEDCYVNFSGAIKKVQTISLKELKEQGIEKRTLKCSCATGPAVANAQVVGVPLKNIMQLVDAEEAANTVVFKSGDGYGIAMPLTYALEKDAIFVYKVGDQDIPSGLQVWVPKSIARYFTRNVTDIEFTVEENVPAVLKALDDQRAKINVMNSFEDAVFQVGDRIVFEGYADDYDVAVSAIEFSMDGGETWTACNVENAKTDKWVYWYFGYTTEKAGTFKLDVRARTADGRVSPMASSIVFTVK